MVLVMESVAVVMKMVLTKVLVPCGAGTGLGGVLVACSGDNGVRVVVLVYGDGNDVTGDGVNGVQCRSSCW